MVINIEKYVTTRIMGTALNTTTTNKHFDMWNLYGHTLRMFYGCPQSWESPGLYTRNILYQTGKKTPNWNNYGDEYDD